MSGEQLSTENTIKTQEVGSDGKVIHSKTNGRVDINTLMNKAFVFSGSRSRALLAAALASACRPSRSWQRAMLQCTAARVESLSFAVAQRSAAA